MVYLQKSTPDYITEAKKRLGLIKQPHVAPNQLNKSTNEKPTMNQSLYASVPEKPVDSDEKKMTKVKQEKHWFQYESSETPDNIKSIRKRLGDDRYRKFDLSKSLTDSKPIKLSNMKTDDLEKAQKTNETSIKEEANPNTDVSNDSQPTSLKIPTPSNLIDNKGSIITYPSTTEYLASYFKNRPGSHNLTTVIENSNKAVLADHQHDQTMDKLLNILPVNENNNQSNNEHILKSMISQHNEKIFTVNL